MEHIRPPFEWKRNCSRGHTSFAFFFLFTNQRAVRGRKTLNVPRSVFAGPTPWSGRVGCGFPWPRIPGACPCDTSAPSRRASPSLPRAGTSPGLSCRGCGGGMCTAVRPRKRTRACSGEESGHAKKKILLWISGKYPKPNVCERHPRNVNEHLRLQWKV